MTASEPDLQRSRVAARRQSRPTSAGSSGGVGPSRRFRLCRLRPDSAAPTGCRLSCSSCILLTAATVLLARHPTWLPARVPSGRRSRCASDSEWDCSGPGSSWAPGSAGCGCVLSGRISSAEIQWSRKPSTAQQRGRLARHSRRGADAASVADARASGPRTRAARHGAAACRAAVCRRRR